MRKSFLLVLVALLFTSSLIAQDAVISGTVTTRDDGSPLPGATISIDNLALSTTSGPDGTFELRVPASLANGQSVQLAASFQGLQSRQATVRLTPGSINQNFALLVSFGEQITVGSRAIGAAEEKAVPVDIFTDEQIAATPSTETAQIIQSMAPSFNFPRTSIADGSDTVRAATLRGLGPDQMLVLINGKRRHASALVHVNNSIGRGSTGVDLNAIPASMIESVEILRDGAAAQYGSDAIAGVINIVLKDGTSPSEISGKAGQTTRGDGELFDGSLSYGFGIGRGSLRASVEYRDRSETNRAGNDPRDQIRPGDAGNNPVPQPNFHWGDSDATDSMLFLNFNMPLTDEGTTQIYAFGGVSERKGRHGGNYRRAIQNTNFPSIYPLGFLPLIEPEVEDQSLTAGARGQMASWFWDASAEYGRNRFDFFVTNSLNVSLGPAIPPNQTEFYSGALESDQVVANVDLSRGFNVGLAGPINVAFGVEYRDDGYQIHAGELASYIDGGRPDQFGGIAVPGAQVFPGFRPSNEVDVSRDSNAFYVDLEGDVLEKLRVGVAARFEDYSDFGSTSDYKLTARFAPVQQFLVRGSVSTGFRAPSLAQSNFNAVSTNFLQNPVTLQLEPFEVGTFPVNSPVARALGAEDLKPEDSRHYSFGAVWQPIENFELTGDYFHIEIEDRIVFSGNFTGVRVLPLIRPFGVTGARFFTNAIDTETDGYDLVANYQMPVANSRLDLSAAYSRNETDIVGTISTPEELAGLQETLFDRIERRRIECGQPEENIRLLQSFASGGFSVTARESMYGEYCSIGFTLDPNWDQTLGEEWIADLDLAYRWNQFTFGLGAQNLFDELPDRTLAGSPQSNLGIFAYPINSPFGMNGTFYYTRLTFEF